jgi:hypothetical protein
MIQYIQFDFTRIDFDGDFRIGVKLFTARRFLPAARLVNCTGAAVRRPISTKRKSAGAALLY